MIGPAADARPLIAVSRCLLGEAVRYDGGHKAFAPLGEPPLSHFRFLALCPEVEAGLTVPRPALQLVRLGGEPRLRQVVVPHLDVTEAVRSQVAARKATLLQVDGAILKRRSPSCGVEDVPVYDGEGNVLYQGRGLFAGALAALRTGLPLVEETQLVTVADREAFVARVLDFMAARTAD